MKFSRLLESYKNISSILFPLFLFYFRFYSYRLKKKYRKEILPRIVSINLDENNIFQLKVMNLKSTDIKFEKILYKEKAGIFYSKKKIPKYTDQQHPEFFNKTNLDIGINDYRIQKDKVFYIFIKSYDPESTYKFFVTTSGGACQAIYCPDVKNP